MSLALMAAAKFIPAVVVLGILPSLIQKWDEHEKDVDMRNTKLNAAYLREEGDEYDYVIIGAGSAGAVVANRLSENETNRVLIIQDGGNPSPFGDIPAFADKVRRQPSLDYMYKIQKQNNVCLGEKRYETSCLFSRGIGLGGTSNLYGMLIVQGNGRDYDHWAELTQDPAWNSTNAWRAFRKLENYHGYFQPRDSRFHGDGGESHVSTTESSTFPPYFYNACAEMGLPTNIDANGNQSVGCAQVDLNVKGGVRWGSYNAFLKPILNRPNLKIYPYARANRINFDAEMRATGVTYVRHGVTREVKAKREVIVCAGAIDSPKLLMLSGIGPKQHLDSVGVESLLDLPVGAFLEDHIGVDLEFTVNKSGIGFVPERDLTSDVVAQYIRNGTGALAAPFFNSRGIAYFSSTEFNSSNWPDIELLLRGAYTRPTANEHGVFLDKFQLKAVLMRPLSAGFLKLSSNSSNDPPIIDPQYFSNESDLRRLVEGIQFGVKMIETTKSFQAIDAKMVPIPACKDLKGNLYFDCAVGQNTVTVCHPTGTVKMGANGDPTAVLDSKLRVRGTKGLRVVDSSIMPLIPAGHTHTPSVMVGQIGSEFILEEGDESNQ